MYTHASGTGKRRHARSQDPRTGAPHGPGRAGRRRGQARVRVPREAARAHGARLLRHPEASAVEPRLLRGRARAAPRRGDVPGCLVSSPGRVRTPGGPRRSAGDRASRRPIDPIPRCVRPGTAPLRRLPLELHAPDLIASSIPTDRLHRSGRAGSPPAALVRPCGGRPAMGGEDGPRRGRVEAEALLRHSLGQALPRVAREERRLA